MSVEARNQLAARVAGDYANGGHRTVFVLDLNAVADVGNEMVVNADSAIAAADQAAASLALALEITGGAAAIGGDPLDLPRNTELGSAAFVDAWALVGMLVETHDATYQIVPGDLRKVLRATSGTRTWTLPVAADVPLGWWCVAKNRSGNNLTINRGSSDTIDAAATSLTIATGASLTIVKATATTWESY